MTDLPLVSVIVPAYNAAAVLRDALRSVAHQTYPRWEAIVVDDGSTDATGDLVREFAARDARFRLIQQPNAGVSAARNAGIAQARGEIIAFLDSDDFWFQPKLEQQLHLWNKHPEANLLFTNYRSWDGQNERELRYQSGSKFPEGNPIRRLIFFNLYATHTILLKRSALEKAGLFDPLLSIGEDWDLWLRLAEDGLNARGLIEPMSYYRVWPGNTMRQSLRVAESNVQVLEKNLEATRRAELRPLYRRSLAIARGQLELARARPFLESAPEKLAPALWNAWRHHPRRLKWLVWFGAVQWPKSMGGALLARLVHREICRRW
jgi:glycosyltransferase involved in cell wall biosynthesis